MRKKFQTAIIFVERCRPAFPCRTFVVRLSADHYVSMWENGEFMNFFSTVCGQSLSHQVRVRIGPRARTCGNKFPRLAENGRHTSSSCLAVRGGLPPQPHPDRVTTSEPPIKKGGQEVKLSEPVGQQPLHFSTAAWQFGYKPRSPFLTSIMSKHFLMKYFV